MIVDTFIQIVEQHQYSLFIDGHFLGIGSIIIATFTYGEHHFNKASSVQYQINIHKLGMEHVHNLAPVQLSEAEYALSPIDRIYTSIQRKVTQRTSSS